MGNNTTEQETSSDVQDKGQDGAVQQPALPAQDNTPAQQSALVDSSAETKKTDTTATDESEYMIPKSRLDKEIERKAELENELKKYQEAEEKRKKAEAKQAQDDALKRGEYEQVINDLTPRADRADRLETTLKGYLQAELEGMPEAYRGLVPTGEQIDITDQLAWIAEAKKSGLFTTTQPKPVAPPLDATQGAKGQTTGLTDQEKFVATSLGLTPDEYREYRKKR